MLKLRKSCNIKATKAQMFDQWAELKIQEKTIKKERKALGLKLIENFTDKTITSMHGKITRYEKEKWEILSITTIVRHLTQTVFNKKASITKSQIVTAIGEAGLKTLIKLKAIKLSETTEHYKLKHKK